MRTRIIILLLAFLPLLCPADEFEVKDFKKDAADLSTQRNPRQDINGEYCALIKVSTDINGVSFVSSQGNCGNTSYNNGEYRVYVPPGERRLEIYADGFAKKYYNIPLPIEASTVYQMVLVRKSTGEADVPQLGMVLIKSTPAGADVIINDKATGKATPFQQPFEAGIYRYTLKKDLYHEVTGEFTILPDQTTTVEKPLPPNFGSLYVETTPESGAVITIDGRMEDKTTPATIELLSPGNHTLSVRKDMYETVQREFAIREGETTRLPITMQPTFAVVTINTDPEAEVFIDNTSKGKGNFSGRLIAGTHIVEVKKAKHYPEKQTLTIQAGKNQQLIINPEPITGTLMIMTNPPEALVSINGIEKGKSPLVINDMIIGIHNIKLKLEGYLDKEITVEVLENQRAQVDEVLEKGKEDYISTPVSTQTTSRDCNGYMTDPRDGQKYKIVRIGNQCWMAENLNYKMDDSWCYKDKSKYCDEYGRLYDWDDAMNACPKGWHVPSDAEWKILEGTVDSQYGVGDPEWDDTGYRGLDAGKKLKSTSGWNSGGNGTDDFGFSALPGGYRLGSGYFHHMGNYATFWSSTEHDAHTAWYRKLVADHDDVARDHGNKGYGRSVRCLRD